jgi:alpha-tubulin suppressor-like RCC1 family protein
MKRILLVLLVVIALVGEGAAFAEWTRPSGVSNVSSESPGKPATNAIDNVYGVGSGTWWEEVSDLANVSADPEGREWGITVDSGRVNTTINGVRLWTGGGGYPPCNIDIIRVCNTTGECYGGGELNRINGENCSINSGDQMFSECYVMPHVGRYVRIGGWYTWGDYCLKNVSYSSSYGYMRGLKEIQVSIEGGVAITTTTTTVTSTSTTSTSVTSTTTMTLPTSTTTTTSTTIPAGPVIDRVIPTVAADNDTLTGYCSSTADNWVIYNYKWFKNQGLNISGVAFSLMGFDAGQDATCAIDAYTQKMMCWGRNRDGRIPVWFDSMYPKYALGDHRYKMIQLADNHGCGIRINDSKLMMWGKMDNGICAQNTTSCVTAVYPIVVAPDYKFDYVACGQNHICAIRQNDSRMMCWGYNNYGQLGVGNTNNYRVPMRTYDKYEYKKVIVGDEFTCALRKNDSRVLCWGRYYEGEIGRTGADYSKAVVVNANERYTDIWAGAQHVVAIRANDSRAVAWGANANGQLCDNTTTDRVAPTRMFSNYKFRTFELKDNYTCGIAVNESRLMCCGAGYSGIITKVGTLYDVFETLSFGINHKCASRANDSRMVCWGSNSYGQLGDATYTVKTYPTPVVNNLNFLNGYYGEVDVPVSIYPGINTAVGSNYTFSCSADNLWGASDWVNTSAVNIQKTTTTSTSSTTTVSTTSTSSTTTVSTLVLHLALGVSFDLVGTANASFDKRFSYNVGVYRGDVLNYTLSIFNKEGLVCGDYHCCAIRYNDSRAMCWGYNSAGQLGDNSTTTRNYPVRVNISIGFSSLAAGDAFTCAIRVNDSKVMCWGAAGRMGVENASLSYGVPHQIDGDLKFKQLSAISDYVCGLTLDGSAVCWGSNTYGKCGNGTSGGVVGRPDHVRAYGSEFVRISAGVSHACAIRDNDSRVLCWGAGSVGNLGGNSTVSRYYANITIDRTPYIDLASGGDFTCGIRFDKRIYCWGSNTNGFLGINSTVQKNFPVPTTYDFKYRSVSAGKYHVCAVRENDSRVLCWGNNGNRNLCDNTTTQRTVPTRIADSRGYRIFTAGRYWSVGVREDNDRLYGCGANNYGMLADGTSTQRNTPYPAKDNSSYFSGFQSPGGNQYIGVVSGAMTSVGETYMVSSNVGNRSANMSWVNSSVVTIYNVTTSTINYGCGSCSGFKCPMLEPGKNYVNLHVTNEYGNNMNCLTACTCPVGYNYTYVGGIASLDSSEADRLYMRWGNGGAQEYYGSKNSFDVDMSGSRNMTLRVYTDGSTSYCGGQTQFTGVVINYIDCQANPTTTTTLPWGDCSYIIPSSVVSCSEPFEGQGCDNCIDDNTGTSWISYGGYPPQPVRNIMFDLGEVKNVESIAVFIPMEVNSTNITVQLSTDQVNWTTFATDWGVKYSGGYYEIVSDPVSTRYIMMNETSYGSEYGGCAEVKVCAAGHVPFPTTTSTTTTTTATTTSSTVPAISCASSSPNVYVKTDVFYTDYTDMRVYNNYCNNDTYIRAFWGNGACTGLNSGNFTCPSNAMYCYEGACVESSPLVTTTTIPAVVANHTSNLSYINRNRSILFSADVKQGTDGLSKYWVMYNSTIAGMEGAISGKNYIQFNTSGMPLGFFVTYSFVNTTTGAVFQSNGYNIRLYTTTTLPCNETDYGRNITVRGQAVFNHIWYNDTCVNSSRLLEMWCSSNKRSLNQEELTCPFNTQGCSDGACVETTSTSVSTTTTTTTTTSSTLPCGSCGGFVVSGGGNLTGGRNNVSMYVLGQYTSNMSCEVGVVCPANTTELIVEGIADLENGSDYFSVRNVLNSSWASVTGKVNFSIKARQPRFFNLSFKTNRNVSFCGGDLYGGVRVTSLFCNGTYIVPTSSTTSTTSTSTTTTTSTSATTTIPTTTTITIPSEIDARVIPASPSYDQCLLGVCESHTVGSYIMDYKWFRNDSYFSEGYVYNKGVVAAGYLFTCAIRTNDSRVLCWGFNSNRQLGINESEVSVPRLLNPERILSNVEFKYLAAGDAFVCGLRKNDSRAMCWGRGVEGQLGITNTTKMGIPREVNGSYPFFSLAAGGDFICGIRNDSRVLCWGENVNGQLGYGGYQDKDYPTLINTTDTFYQIDAGARFVCGLRVRDSKAVCWGSNARGQQGVEGNFEHGAGFKEVNVSYEFKYITTGDDFTCAIRANDSKLMCWGANDMAQLGDYTISDSSIPKLTNFTGAVSTVSAGAQHACAIRVNDSKVICWGNRYDYYPRNISTIYSFSAIYAGSYHMCGIRVADNRLLCWGTNSQGELGDGNTADSFIPVLVNSSAYYYPGFADNMSVVADVIPVGYTHANDSWVVSCKSYTNGGAGHWVNSSMVYISPTTTSTTSTSTTTTTMGNVTTTTTSSTTSTTTITSTSTTTTLPIVLKLNIPPEGSHAFIEKNRIVSSVVEVDCYAASCGNTQVTFYASNLTILSTNPVSCGTIQGGKSCNTTFVVNMTGSVNNTYVMWAAVSSLVGGDVTSGFNATIISTEDVMPSIIDVVIVNMPSNFYTMHDRMFDVVVNVTCRRGGCGIVDVYLDPPWNPNITIVSPQSGYDYSNLTWAPYFTCLDCASGPGSCQYSIYNYMQEGILNNPYGISSDSLYVYVADTGNNRIIKRFASNLSYDSQIGRLFNGDAIFSSPYGVYSDGTYIYVLDSGNSRIMKHLASNLSYVSEIGSYGSGDDQVDYPMGISGDGVYIYVADTNNNRVVKRFASNLSYDSQVGTLGTGDDQFDHPSGVFSDGVYIYVADTNNNRIVKRFASNLSYDSQVGIYGSGNDEFNYPFGISGDDTYIYVVDTYSNRIVKRLASNLSYVSQIGDGGSGDDQFYNPYGVSSDGTYIYVADTFNNRIVKRFASNLSYISQVGSFGDVIIPVFNDTDCINNGTDIPLPEYIGNWMLFVKGSNTTGNWGDIKSVIFSFVANVSTTTTSTSTTSTSSTSTTTTTLSSTSTTIPLAKGIVPMNAGIPFYTITQNPYTCGELWEGMSCGVRFTVNATGVSGGVARMFAIANNSYGYGDYSESHYVYILPQNVNSSGVGHFNDTYLCNISATDPDGDKVYTVNSSVDWLLNGTVIANGSSVLDCSSGGLCKKGNNLFCFGCVVDQHGYDDICMQSPSVYINNTLPVVMPYIVPFVPEYGDNLLCNENATDPEHDTLNFTYKWFMNDTVTSYTSRTLGALATKSNERWRCRVVAFDGSAYVVANSSEVYIVGACPSIPLLVSPMNDSDASANIVHFDWNDSSVEGIGDIYYNIQVSNNSNFTANAIDVNPIPSFYDSGEKLIEHRYWWRVRAYSFGCYSNWSLTWTVVRTNGSCRDGIKNYHNGTWEVGVDCGGPCVKECSCANLSKAQITVQAQNDASGLFQTVKLNITDHDDFEFHCRDGCYGPEFGETDTDCGGFGVWACPQCGVGQKCLSDYDCRDGLYCHVGAGGYSDYGRCMSNVELEACKNGIFNPTVGESDIDCGGPCNRCAVGKMCNGTMDCQDQLVCNQYDKCTTPTDETSLKKGRQFGGIGLRGTGMNAAYCSGSGRSYEVKPEKPDGLGGYVGCSQITGIEPLAAPFTGWMYGRGFSTLLYGIDASDFRRLWLGDQGKDMPSIDGTHRVVYHVDIGYKQSNGVTLWIPFWMASAGQEYKCKDDNDCAMYGVWGVKSGDTIDSLTGAGNYINFGKCIYGAWSTSGVMGTITCNIICATANAKNYLMNPSTWAGLMDILKCPDECKHCQAFDGSVPFDGYDAVTRGFKSGYPTIPQSECMYIPLCGGFDYRVSAKLYNVDGAGRQKDIPRIDRSVFPVCVSTFTAGLMENSVAKLECQFTDELPSVLNQQYNTPNACREPLFWDVGRCDGEEPVQEYSIDPLNLEGSFRRYYKETGCMYTDDVANLWFIRSSCLLSPDEDQLFSSLIQRSLKEFKCVKGEPKDVLIDFEDFYKNILSDPTFKGGKYYREWNQASSSKKVLMLITRNAQDGRKCLVYDNLNANAFKVWTDSATYFDLYRGGDSISDRRYGPRIRLPLCEDETYTITLAFMNDAMSLQADKTYRSIGDYLYSVAWRNTINRWAGYDIIDINDPLIPGSVKNFVASHLPGADFKCTKLFSRDNGCVKDVYFEEMLKDKSIEIIGVNTFKLSRGQTNVLTTDENTGESFCYTDFYYKYSYDKNQMGNVNVDWYNLKNTNSATILETDKWLGTFYKIFHPFNLSPPFGFTSADILEEFFNKGLMAGMYMVMLVFIYYLSKILIWVLLYGLISYLWLNMAKRGVSIYAILLAIFLVLLILGKFESYDSFIRLLTGGL